MRREQDGRILALTRRVPAECTQAHAGFRLFINAAQNCQVEANGADGASEASGGGGGRGDAGWYT